ncbi:MULTISPECIES: hypothetical protein [Actinosynnema]|uniref:hypothetical protein n=1 Tax=Actinosynnema TaxID=40566 RepID=UPI0020A2B12B|nr:hypothetical protein [Actinosynnema pretiosum]
MSAMRISQLAERTGVPATTRRSPETAGPLPADRTPARAAPSARPPEPAPS